MLAAKVSRTAQRERCRAEAVEGLLVSGLLTYDLCADAIARSLRLIWSGEWVFPGDLALGRTPPAQPGDNEPRGGGARLSRREKEVLLKVAEGHSNAEIAQHLGATEATVKVHLKKLLRKIRVDNRTQATIWALANLPEAAARVAD